VKGLNMATSMIVEFFKFEISYQRKSWLYWIIAVLFALMAFGAASSDAIQIGGAIGNVQRNAPITVINLLSLFTLIGMLLTVAFVASPLLREADFNSVDMLFSKPFAARDLVIGRLLAGAAMCVGIYLLVALGILLGSVAPWADAAQFGPTHWSAYAFAFGVMVLPNVLLVSAIFAALAARFRSLMAVYVGVIGLFVAMIVARNLIRDIENRWLVVLSDPFGISALRLTTRYWSAAESNTAIPTLLGYVGANRLIWLSIAGILFAYALWRYNPNPRLSGKASAQMLEAPAATMPAAAIINVVKAAALPKPSISGGQFAAFWQLLKFDTRFVLLGFPFLAMLLFGMVNFFAAAVLPGRLLGTKIYPVSYVMVDAIQGGLQWLLAIIVTFYAGELVWRERAAKIHEIVDTTPVGNAAPMLAKVVALLAVIAVFSAVGVLGGMLFQLSRGYYHFEPWVYFSGVLISSIPYVLMGLLAVALQVITGNKFVGYGAILLVIISQITLALLDFGHNLLIFGAVPNAVYSDMNQWGASIPGVLGFASYWLLLVIAILLLASAFWTRGIAGSFTERSRIALSRLRGPTGVAFAAAMLAFAGTGAWLLHQTNVVNTYLSPDTRLDMQADYERKYKALENQPQPRVVAIKLDVDIYPKLQKAAVRGVLQLQNRSAVPITELIVQAPDDVELKLTLPAHSIKVDDLPLQFRVYRLEQAIAPGATLSVAFASVLAAHGIRNEGAMTKVNANGTFFNNRDIMPSFGYQARAEITDPNARRTRHLGPARRMPKLEDTAARANTYIANDSDWIQFETTVSTDSDQIALSPGYLQREWSEGGRRYFHYTMDKPILNFFSYLSARWQVTKGDWHGLPIEVYHHPTHDKNVQGMIRGVQKSLDYFTANFSPYQHKQVRIVEFPRYASFAQSFPNTIPYSESVGFIADVRDTDAIDYPFYLTAHEVAHQWWAHQVIGANVQGSTMLSESLAQYSALMVMQHEYGPQKMRRFLKYELDNYLSSRGDERNEELPLYRVENQPYIHYRKGSLVFYRLQDELGEKVVNQALAEFIQKTAFQAAPFTTSAELISILRAHAPAAKQQLITDLFEKISFYDNRLEAATAVKLANGKYQVTLSLVAHKFYADGKGAETAAPMHDQIDVAVFANSASGKPDDQRMLYFKKHTISSEPTTITVIVDEKPDEAGFDPYNKLIDRVSRDNRKAVSLGG